MAVSDGWGARLLGDLGMSANVPAHVAAEHPALLAQRVGLHEMIGPSDGAPRVYPLPLAACAQGALSALTCIAPNSGLDHMDGAALLTERAALAGLRRNGTASPGGACRLLPTADGWLAVNLPRDDDWALLPAWLQAQVEPGWPALAAHLTGRTGSELIGRGRLLGLAVAADHFSHMPVPWHRIVQGKPLNTPVPAKEGRAGRRPRVVDLSSLWAGPLCGRLLAYCGADVIKVETYERPDGARRGSDAFYALLNGGKLSVALDFATPGGRHQLQALLASADIIIESARPRGLRQLGICAEEVVADARRPTWVAISGYGRSPECESHVAYGDDAAVAAGASRLLFEASGEHWMIGDALADPLTGIHAALAAWASWRRGGGRLVSLALRDVARACLQFDLPPDIGALRRRHAAWTNVVTGSRIVPECRLPHVPPGPVAALGADTERVLDDCNALC